MGTILRFVRWIWRRWSDYRGADALLDLLDWKVGIISAIGAVVMLFFGATNQAWSAPGVVLAALIAAACIAVIAVGIRAFFLPPIAPPSLSKPSQADVANEWMPLSDAAAQLYGEVRGTTLAKLNERFARGSNDRLLDYMGTTIVRHTRLRFKRPPSPKLEILPTSELDKIIICNGAKAFRYFGRGALFTDLEVPNAELPRIISEVRQTADLGRGEDA